MIEMVFSDLEGPWVKADHAFDAVSKAVPGGARLFSILSSYDDYRFFVEHAEGYEPGDTLKLIAPFLLVYGVDDAFLRTIANLPSNTSIIPEAREAIRHIKEYQCFYLISTSYEQYVERAASLLGVEVQKAYSTHFPIDGYRDSLRKDDLALVKDWASRILQMPLIETDQSGELSGSSLEAKGELDRFFWEILPTTSFRTLMEELEPVGGSRKFRALEEALEAEGKGISSAMVVGDSITDSVMLERTRDAGGLAVSFNGNRYSIFNSNAAIISSNCWPTAALSEVFQVSGLRGVEESAGIWDASRLSDLESSGLIGEDLYAAMGDAQDGSSPPEVHWLEAVDVDRVVEESEDFRKRVRGEEIGSLG